MHTLKNSSGSGEAAVEAGASAFSSAAGGGSRLAGLSAAPVFASPSRLTGFSMLPDPGFPSAFPSSPAAAAAAAALAFSESPMKSRGLGALAWMASFTAAVSAAWMPFFLPTGGREVRWWEVAEGGREVALEVGADLLRARHLFLRCERSCWLLLFHTTRKLAQL